MTSLHTEPQVYHPMTRILHAGLVLGVTFQLLCAVWMNHPEHAHDSMKTAVVVIPHSDTEHHEKTQAEGWGDALMAAHRLAGIGVALIVLAHVAWSLMLRGNPRKRQFLILFSAQAWRDAGQTGKALFRWACGLGKLPPSGHALARVIEMLGLLTMTMMAMTGIWIAWLWGGVGMQVSESAETLMAWHAGLARVLWAYLLVHVGMALLYALSGDRIFSRIMPRWRR